MLRDGSTSGVEDSGAETWTGGVAATTAQRAPLPGWEQIHTKLRSNSRQRAALDASEAYWLREAERVQIWKEFGMVSMLDYMDRVLNYAPRTARDRLRVARALEHLPLITESLTEEDGLGFSAVKELVRVATPDTEIEWIAAATGKSQREIEELVAGHSPGDLPDDPPDPEVRTRTLSFELSPLPYARLRQAQLALAEELGHQPDDDELFTAFADAVLARGADTKDGSGRAPYQLGIGVCSCCDRATIDVAGVEVPIDAATLAQARCDAQHIGSLDGGSLARATQDIPPRTRRLIWRRDKGRCQTPGCRSKRCLEIHHIIAREDGGTHDPGNLSLRCGSCHSAHHRGLLTISGTAPDKLVTTRHRDHRAPVGAAARTTPVMAGGAADHPAVERARSDSASAAMPTLTRPPPMMSAHMPAFELATLRAQARDALVGLGWKRAIACAAVSEACAHVTPGTSLEVVIRDALQRCLKPSG